MRRRDALAETSRLYDLGREMRRRAETWGGVYVGNPATGTIEALPLPKPALVRQFRAMRERHERRSVTRRTSPSRGDPDPELVPRPLRPLERRWMESLDGDELLRVVRGINAVDRAVRGFRNAP